MRKIVDYCIVVDTFTIGRDELEQRRGEKVLEKIDSGWHPIGGASIASMRQSGNFSWVYTCAQAMVKYEEEDEEAV